MSRIPKTCEDCGGPIEAGIGPGRVHEYRRGLDLPIPDEFVIPTCSKCGERYLSEDGYRALAEAQKPAFIEWQKQHLGAVIRSIRERHGVRLRDVERACDVTATYLSHVLGGRNEASQVLINLLEAFALYPAEFQRKLRGTSWEASRLAAMRLPRVQSGYGSERVELAHARRDGTEPYSAVATLRGGSAVVDMSVRRTG